MVDNYSEYMPCIKAEIAAIVDDGNNNSEYLPYSEIEIAAIVDDDNSDNNYLPWEVTGVVVDSYDDDRNDFMTYMIMTDNTNGDRTIPYDDMVYDKRCV